MIEMTDTAAVVIATIVLGVAFLVLDAVRLLRDCRDSTLQSRSVHWDEATVSSCGPSASQRPPTSQQLPQPVRLRSNGSNRSSGATTVQGVEVRTTPLAPLLSAAYVRNLTPHSDEGVGLRRACSDEIGKTPAWGKGTAALAKDVMFTCVRRAGRTSLDAFEPMERVALSASGTFQRTVSSYYNAPVYVETDYNEFPSRGKCRRQVTMSVGGHEFAVCTSHMKIVKPELIDAVENKGVAIGQLFRHFELMPEYALLAAGMDEERPEQFLWRVYTLTVEGAVTCRIHEKIRRDVFDLQLDPNDLVASTSPGADVVKPNVTFMELPEGFSQLERILLTANANVERIIGSYYNMPTIVHVMQNYRREPCVFERRTAMLLHGEEFMYANSTVFLADQKWEECMLNNHKAGLGQVFTMMGVQPTFKLRDAGRTPNSFWRVYTLSSPAVTVQITETFNMYIFTLDSRGSGNEYNFVYAPTEGHTEYTPTEAGSPRCTSEEEEEEEEDDCSGEDVAALPLGASIGKHWHSAFVKMSAARALARGSIAHAGDEAPLV